MNNQNEKNKKSNILKEKLCNPMGLSYIFAKIIIKRDHSVYQKVFDDSYNLTYEDFAEIHNAYTKLMNEFDKKIKYLAAKTDIQFWVLKDSILRDEEVFKSIMSLDTNGFIAFIEKAPNEDVDDYIRHILTNTIMSPDNDGGDIPIN